MHPLFASSHHDGGQVDDDQDVGGDQPRRKATLSIREDGGGQEERKVGHPPGNQLYDRRQERSTEANAVASYVSHTQTQQALARCCLMGGAFAQGKVEVGWQGNAQPDSALDT
jgi:hypothetical protein